jgi:hypothetical protein
MMIFFAGELLEEEKTLAQCGLEEGYISLKI